MSRELDPIRRLRSDVIGQRVYLAQEFRVCFAIDGPTQPSLRRECDGGLFSKQDSRDLMESSSRARCMGAYLYFLSFEILEVVPCCGSRSSKRAEHNQHMGGCGFTPQQFSYFDAGLWHEHLWFGAWSQVSMQASGSIKTIENESSPITRIWCGKESTQCLKRPSDAVQVFGWTRLLASDAKQAERLLRKQL